MEIASPLILTSRRIRMVWLALIVPFHFMTLFAMNIFFWENLVLIMLVFTSMTAMAARMVSKARFVQPVS
jgi:hypothetical protein